MEENGKIEITDGLLMAHIAGELDVQLNQHVENWIAASEENTAHFIKMRKAWNVTGEIEPKPVVVDSNAAWDSVLNKINKADRKVIPIQKSNRRAYIGVAAMIVIMVGIFAVLNMNNPSVETVTHLAEYAGVEDQLEDGSVVTLNANTSLVYPREFAEDERRVALQGEAFFDIERNEEKPFIIDLPANTTVKVLGTSFNIKAVEEDSIVEVFVSTGRVEFGSKDSTIILVAGEKGKYNKITGKVYKVNVSTTGATELFWMDKELTFDGVKLSEFMTVINNFYEDEISLACESYKDSLIHTDINTRTDSTLIQVIELVANIYPFNVVELDKGDHKEFTLDCNED